MKKITVLGIALGVLVLLNLILITMFFIGPRHPDRLGPPQARDLNGLTPRDIIISQLSFNENQISKYDELIKKHRSEINKLDTEIRISKQKLYALLKSNFSLVDKESLIAEINSYQKQIEEIHFNHFLEIKKICNAKQLKLFESLAPEFDKLFSPHRPMPR